MNARLIAPIIALLCLLSIAGEAGATVGKIQVSEGPTPFIRFAHTQVSDITGFKSAQFQIWPKTGSATRSIKVRYARSYLEARGYFDPNNGSLTIPVLVSTRAAQTASGSPWLSTTEFTGSEGLA